MPFHQKTGFDFNVCGIACMLLGVWSVRDLQPKHLDIRREAEILELRLYRIFGESDQGPRISRNNHLHIRI